MGRNTHCDSLIILLTIYEREESIEPLKRYDLKAVFV